MNIKDNFVIATIGDGSSGRATTIKKLAKLWKTENKGNIICFDPLQEFQDICDLEIVRNQEFISRTQYEINDSLIIMKEFNYLGKSTDISDGLITKRSRNCDYILCSRSPSDYRGKLSQFITHYMVFYREKLKNRFYAAHHFGSHDVLNAASSFLKKYVKKNGSGAYPDFPYFIFDRRTVVFYNLHKSKISKEWTKALNRSISRKHKIQTKIL